MTDYERGAPQARPEEEREPSLGQVAERAVRSVPTAMVISGALIALAIYARPAPSRYDAFAMEGRIVRVDTRSGTILSCDGKECVIIVRRGQSVKRSRELLLPKPAEQPAPVPVAQPKAP